MQFDFYKYVFKIHYGLMLKEHLSKLMKIKA